MNPKIPQFKGLKAKEQEGLGRNIECGSICFPAKTRALKPSKRNRHISLFEGEDDLRSTDMFYKKTLSWSSDVFEKRRQGVK